MDPKVEQLHSRADSLFAKFAQGGGTDYIDEAIVLDRQALKICPPGHPARFLSLNQLAFHLGDRHSQLRVMLDLEEAVVLIREVLDLCPRGHPLRSTPLNNVAMHLSSRYKQLRVMTDLDEAIALGQEALDLRPRGHLDHTMSLNILADALSTRYEQLGAITDLNKAIVLGREALDLCPRQHFVRSIPLNILTDSLFTRYQQLGEIKDLDEAIVLGREALNLCPRGHPDRSMPLDSLARSLSARFSRLGKMTDLDTAVLLAQESLQLRPRGHPDRSISLDRLSVHLITRYKRLGIMADLDKAIVLARKALKLRPAGHPDRSTPLHNLAESLSTRHKHLGAMTDLDEAIVLVKEALELLPQGHHLRVTSLNNVALYLSTRFKEVGTMRDLNEAIIRGREALKLCPGEHSHRSTTLNNLAVYLSARFNQDGAVTDLDEAIVLGRDALDLCPRGHPDRPMRLNNLAVDLSTRYRQLGTMTNLDEAIDLARDALPLCPSGHPDRSRSVGDLARYLCTRFTQSNQLKDQEDIFSLYSELAHLPQILSSHDLLAAKAWVNAAEDFHHPTTVLAYETSLRLLVQHLATLPSLPQHLPILKELTSSLAVDAFSACLRNQDPTNAVELLEQGRGVFWNQLTRLHSPLDEVTASSPAGKTLVDKFTRLTSLIRDAINSPSADQHDRVCRLNLHMQGIVSNIRKLPGLSRFLLPSLFSDLQRAASGGPVIIVNASQYTCDALVIFVDRDPIHIPLQITKDRIQDLSLHLQSLTLRAMKMDVRRDLGLFLRELWDEIVSPIVDFLQTIVPAQSRIWWCPTAEFSLLPLHAAGPYRRGQPNLSRRYISSYTPTLTALIRARRHGPSISITQGKHFVAIGQAKAAGEGELVSVGSELAIIGQRIEGRATFTRIEGQESCISRVSEELSKNEWVHLACHGLPDREQPFASAFALHDGHFTIQHIIRCELENAEFAYLSACHTTVGDEESPDEVIHLASAMQFAGFRSVIGTMWAVDDGETNKITSMFYDNMMDESGRLDHTRAAFALNKTMNNLVDIPFDQRILYVHIGA